MVQHFWRCSAAVALWLMMSACAVPVRPPAQPRPPVPPVPDPVTWSLSVLVLDARDNQPVPGVAVEVLGRFRATRIARQTDTLGIVRATDVPQDEYRVTVATPGFVTVQHVFDLHADREEVVLLTETVPVVTHSLLGWRGDFLGDFHEPALMIGGMPPEQRQHLYAEHRARGYTHVPLSVANDYPAFPDWHWDWWGDPATMKARLDEIRIAGLLPVPVLHPRAGMSIDEHLDAVRALWPHIAPYTTGVTWGWEINDLGGEWGSGSHLLRYLDGLRAIVGVPIFVHFTPQRWSGWPSYDGSEPDRDEVEWLVEARNRGVVGLLYQEWYSTDEDATVSRMVEIPSPHGRRPGIAGRVVDGAGIAFIAFEYSRDRARGERIGARVMQHGTVSGFGNGGPSRVP